jgi:hypothetical protein
MVTITLILRNQKPTFISLTLNLTQVTVKKLADLLDAYGEAYPNDDPPDILVIMLGLGL